MCKKEAPIGASFFENKQLLKILLFLLHLLDECAILNKKVFNGGLYEQYL